MHATTKQASHHEVRNHHHTTAIFFCFTIAMIAFVAMIVLRLKAKAAATQGEPDKVMSYRGRRKDLEGEKVPGVLSRSKNSHLAKLMRNEPTSSCSEITAEPIGEEPPKVAP